MSSKSKMSVSVMAELEPDQLDATTAAIVHVIEERSADFGITNHPGVGVTITLDETPKESRVGYRSYYEPLELQKASLETYKEHVGKITLGFFAEPIESDDNDEAYLVTVEEVQLIPPTYKSKHTPLFKYTVKGASKDDFEITSQEVLQVKQATPAADLKKKHFYYGSQEKPTKIVYSEANPEG